MAETAQEAAKVLAVDVHEG